MASGARGPGAYINFESIQLEKLRFVGLCHGNISGVGAVMAVRLGALAVADFVACPNHGAKPTQLSSSQCWWGFFRFDGAYTPHEYGLPASDRRKDGTLADACCR